MNRIKIIQISLFTLALVGLMACATKRRALKDSALAKYDAATFDYLYAEALRKKFMGDGRESLMYFEQARRLNPNSDAVNYQIAQILLSVGNLKNGKVYAKRAHQLDPQNIWYSALLAGVYYQENKIDSAIYIYEKAAQQAPNNDDLQILLANLYSENGDFENAIRVHQELQLRYGINENTTPVYIQILILAEKYDLAMQEAQEAIKLFPDEIGYYAQLAEIYSKKGEGLKAIDVYRQLLEENPQNSQILVLVCDFLLNEKLYDDFFQILTPVILDDEISKEDKISLFAKLIEAPNLDESVIDQTVLALMVFESVSENDEVVVLLRPKLLSNNNRKEGAIRLLEGVVSKRPDNYFAWESLLLLCYETKNFSKLMAYGGECASRFNQSIFAKLLYAHGALENKRYDIALEELRKAAILANDNEEAMVQIFSMKAEVLYRMDNFSEAFKTFEEALKVTPNDMIILNNYAYYLAEHDMELKKAEAMSRKVIEKEKDNATYLDTYAWVLFKMGKTKAAAKIMEQVIAQGSNLSAEHYEHYGFMLKKLKKCNQAVENWEIAIKLDSSKNNLTNEIENCGKR